MASPSTVSQAPFPDSQVDLLIHAKWLLPMHCAQQILQDHAVAVQGGNILAILPSAEASTQLTARCEVKLPHHALLPGLINAHGHSAMTLLRGYADDIALKPWLEEHIWPAESRWVSEAFVQDGARIAIAEMLLGGVTCFNDMYYFPDQVAAAALEARIRTQLAAPVLDFPTVWAANAAEYIHKATVLHDEYRNNPFVYTAFGPHAAYTVSDAPLRKIAMLAEELDIPIHIHLHENAQEIREAQAGGGVRPFQRLCDMGLMSPRLQAVHMTQLEEEEIALLADHGVSVVHCPASNLKLASGFCPVAKLLDAGVNVCLGTDGAASNNDLDILNEMHLAALLGKVVADDAAAVNAWQALEMATINGARAMGLEDRMGSLAPGKYADLVAIDLSRINSQPIYDPASSLVYSTSSSQVSHVWVGGQLNVENRRLLSLDQGRLIERATAWADKIGGLGTNAG